MGEDSAVWIKFGKDAGEGASEDTILIHGSSSDVDRAVKDILRIVEDAKNDLILSGYVRVFSFFFWRLLDA
jgi:hypothetical protein